MWNHHKSDEEVFAQPTKQTQPSSAFFFINILLLFVLFLFFGYSVYQYLILIRNSEREQKLNLQLGEIIISLHEVIEEADSLINKGVMVFNKYEKSFSTYEKLKREYLSIDELHKLSTKSDDSINNSTRITTNNYFNSAEIFFLKVKNMLSRAKPEITSYASTDLAVISECYRNLNELFHQTVKANYNQLYRRSVINDLQVKKNQYYLFVYCTCLLLYSIIVIYLFFRGRKKILVELQKFYALLERSANPMQVVDKNGITKYVNPAFVLWSGIKKEEIINKNVFTFIKNSGSNINTEELWEEASNLLLKGKAWIGEIEFENPPTNKVFSNVIVSPVLDTNGLVTECIVVYNDQTELKKYARKIIETQKHYESIVESSLDAIIISQNDKIVYVNPSAVRLFGYASAEDMLKLNMIDIVSIQNKFFLQAEQNLYVIGEKILTNYEVRGLTRLGKMIDLEMNAHMIEWNNKPAIQTSFRDITERKMLEREQSLWLWEQETLSDIDRKLVGIMELEKIFTAILQQTLNLTRANFAGVILFEKDSEQVKWQSINGNIYQHVLGPFFPNDTIKSILSKREPLIIDYSTDNPQYPLIDIPVVLKEKLISTIWLPLVIEGKNKGALVVGYRHKHDFSGREMRLLVSIAEKHTIAIVNAQLYENLLEREKELEILSGARVKAQEDERRRIAREIHDGLGQMLTAIKFNLEILEDAIDVGSEEKNRIQDMKKLLDDVMKEAREISYNLMPSVLDDFGLAPALQLLSEQFSNRTNIKVNYTTHNLRGRFDPQIEISLYRIVQEGLNNVAKHSNATEVNLQVIQNEKGIKLVMEDNGKGMSASMIKIQPSFKSGMGLVSMRERANALGGTLVIDSLPKNGTLILVEIPITESNVNGKNTDTNSR